MTSNNRPINFQGPNQQQPPLQRSPSQQLTITQERRARRYQKTSIVQATNERQQSEINQLRETLADYETRLATTEAQLNEQRKTTDQLIKVLIHAFESQNQ